MLALNSTTLALALAVQAGTLRVEERTTRFGDTAFFLSDEYGLVEVCLTKAEANDRLAEVNQRATR